MDVPIRFGSMAQILKIRVDFPFIAKALLSKWHTGGTQVRLEHKQLMLEVQRWINITCSACRFYKTIYIILELKMVYLLLYILLMFSSFVTISSLFWSLIYEASKFSVSSGLAMFSCKFLRTYGEASKFNRHRPEGNRFAVSRPSSKEINQQFPPSSLQIFWC
jgi:hypothetical protein